MKIDKQQASMKSEMSSAIGGYERALEKVLVE